MFNYVRDQSKISFGDLFERFKAADAIRKSSVFINSFDLQTFGNHLSSSPTFFRNSSTIAYETIELNAHLAEDKKTEFVPLKVSLYFSILNSMATTRVPKSVSCAKISPGVFALSSEFGRYRSLLRMGQEWTLQSADSFEKCLDFLERVLRKVFHLEKIIRTSNLESVAVWHEKLSAFKDSKIDANNAESDFRKLVVKLDVDVTAKLSKLFQILREMETAIEKNRPASE